MRIRLVLAVLAVSWAAVETQAQETRRGHGTFKLAGDSGRTKAAALPMLDMDELFVCKAR